MKPADQEILIGTYREAFPDAARLVKRLGGTMEEAKDSFHDALFASAQVWSADPGFN